MINNKSEKRRNLPSNIDSPIENNDFMEWSVEKENLLVEWCDIAQCYKWLNSSSHRTYTQMHEWFTIPAIVLSTLTGTASFAQLSFPVGVVNYSPYIIGTVTIFIGVLTTVQQYLKVTELKENYRISAILWDKYARNIRIELARAPDERMDARNFLKLTRNELDHLMETTPLISHKTVKKFKLKFMGEENSPERKIYDALKKPDICGTIVSSETSRHHWFKEIEVGTLYGRKSITAPLRKHKLKIFDDDKNIDLKILKFNDDAGEIQQYKNSISDNFFYTDEIPKPTEDIETGLISIQ